MPKAPSPERQLSWRGDDAVWRWPRVTPTAREGCGDPRAGVPDAAESTHWGSRHAALSGHRSADRPPEPGGVTAPIHLPFGISRRDVIRSAAALALTGLVPSSIGATLRAQQPPSRAVTRGRLRQSVSRWCYQKIPLPDLCRAVAAMGVPAIDLLEAQDWPVVREHGLVCSMGYGGGGTIRDGLNNPANHDRIVNNLTAAMPKAAALGVPNLITFFGNRQGRGDREAIENCVTGLNRLKAAAEQHQITICVELLNSKVDHADYQGDRTAFGVEVVSAVNSPRVKLLYDIYHMQIMEGDVIRTIRQHHRHISHYHTGGVPGRHELDDTQELQWPAICRAIVETGFTGYFAHEFVPVRDPMTSLREAVVLCDV